MIKQFFNFTVIFIVSCMFFLTQKIVLRLYLARYDFGLILSKLLFTFFQRYKRIPVCGSWRDRNVLKITDSFS